MGKPWERWVAAFDNHGDQADAGAVRAFREFVADFRPRVRIHGGDCFDLRWLRRSAADKEKIESVVNDLNAGMDFLSWFKPTVFLWGNHDHRLHDAMTAPHGDTRESATRWIDKIKANTPGCAHLPYCKRRGVFQYGDHKFLHGYSCGIGAARKLALTYGNAVMGHVHAHDAQPVERLDGATGHTVGCLAVLDMDYNRASMGTLRQDQGWAYGYKAPTGQVVVLHARKIAGRWVCPTLA